VFSIERFCGGVSANGLKLKAQEDVSIWFRVVVSLAAFLVR
jgi:hypothetical protein